MWAGWDHASTQYGRVCWSICCWSLHVGAPNKVVQCHMSDPTTTLTQAVLQHHNGSHSTTISPALEQLTPVHVHTEIEMSQPLMLLAAKNSFQLTIDACCPNRRFTARANSCSTLCTSGTRTSGQAARWVQDASRSTATGSNAPARCEESRSVTYCPLGMLRQPPEWLA